MSDQQQGDYPSPTAAQSGPYPHRPTTDAQLVQQLSQAMEPQGPAGDYGRPHGAAAEVQPMPWAGTAPPPAHSMAAPAPPTQYAQYAPEIQQQMAGVQSSPGDDEPTKKKQKTSRACDECRRKKIKCDGDGEKPGFKCANCMRTNAECLYTKPAQKRGPSRGYIRELSDRVASLEELRVGMSPMTPQNPSSIFADGVDSHGIKRTHSISEHGTSESLKTPYSATTPSIAPLARMAQALNHTDSGLNLQFKMNLPAVSQPLTPAERNELSTFMTSAQPRLPVLPEETKETEHLLNAATGPIRDAFFKCLKAVATLPASSDRSLYKQAYTSALELVHRPESVSTLANVVHLQICVLLLYISGTYGVVNPETLDEPNEKILYGTAMGIASTLKLNGSHVPQAQDAVEDLTIKHGRRVYGLFHCLNAWTSLAHGHALYAPLQEFTPDAADGKATDSDAFLYSAMVPDLARFYARFAKKDTWGEYGSLFFDGVMLGLGVAQPSQYKLDAGVRAGKAGLEIFRAIAESGSAKALAVPPGILDSAADIVRTYAQDAAPFFLVGHHTFGLAVRALLLAADHPDTNEQAVAALKDARALLDAGKFLHEDGWRTPIEKSIAARLLNDKPADKPEPVSCIDIVHGGWMSAFA